MAPVIKPPQNANVREKMYVKTYIFFMIDKYI